ncbi:LOW QUALITY PROTEIN: hypothetical protein TorRG33x02_187150 [Trema orientale]|uniref:Uncharacterized protein n=1 Tax=Trema orientale TaxID=63057 RepID=A0A2P5EJ46_TREOI|nr:LOW QUALITY PROTEIN: hypothetical protein TorRG33x02_187150 [Trema orientale]
MRILFLKKVKFWVRFFGYNVSWPISLEEKRLRHVSLNRYIRKAPLKIGLSLNPKLGKHGPKYSSSKKTRSHKISPKSKIILLSLNNPYNVETLGTKRKLNTDDINAQGGGKKGKTSVCSDFPTVLARSASSAE